MQGQNQNRNYFLFQESKMNVFYHRTAFLCWLVANILFSMPVIIYAGYMMILTAAFIFFSMASFSTIYNTAPCDFTIGADSFRASYSHSFWLALAMGKCSLKENIQLIQMILIPTKYHMLNRSKLLCFFQVFLMIIIYHNCMHMQF